MGTLAAATGPTSADTTFSPLLTMNWLQKQGGQYSRKPRLEKDGAHRRVRNRGAPAPLHHEPDVCLCLGIILLLAKGLQPFGEGTQPRIG